MSVQMSVHQRINDWLARYDAAGDTVADILCDGHDPDRIAYIMVDAAFARRELRYGWLRDESMRLAAGFAAIGIGPGDRVATLMGKSADYLVCLLAIWRLGAVHVPLFTAFAPAAIAYRLHGAAVKLVLCDAAQAPKLAPGEDMPADAPWRVVTTGPAAGGMLSLDTVRAPAGTVFAAAPSGGDTPIIHIFTSGTTGRPKGLVVPKRALAAFRIYAEYGLGLLPDDIYWCGADPGWAYGLYYGVLATFLTGTRSVMLEANFSPEAAIRVLADCGVTNFSAAPTVFRSIRAAAVDIPPLSLRALSSAGEPLTPEVNDWATRALGAPVHDHYGQTETGMMINNHHHPELARPLIAGSMGQAMPGWSMVVLAHDADVPANDGSVGRVAADLPASPLAWFSGYLGNAEATAERMSADGRWYLTGDVGRRDAAGNFFFSSRDDDVIIMAGYRIGPFDVESVIAAHPAVIESAVIAVPDAVRGEVMEAFVVLAQGHAPDDALADDIRHWVKTRYAAHAYPRTVLFTDALPKTPSGKVQRFVLRQQRIAALGGTLA